MGVKQIISIISQNSQVLFNHRIYSGEQTHFYYHCKCKFENESLFHSTKVKKLPFQTIYSKFRLSGMDITLPGFVAFGLTEQDYRYVARFDGLSARYHASISRHFVAFSPVARYTGRYHIGPFGLTAPRPGDNVIYR
jgi:hypothetical protein